jgi:hypothetical protein
MRRLLTSLVLAAALLVGASAQQQPQPPAPSSADVSAEDVSLHGYGDKNPTCQEWTDGCRSCRRDASGDPVCPNIGPACQPKAISCARRTEAPKEPQK